MNYIDILCICIYILYMHICDISLYDENASVNKGGCLQRWVELTFAHGVNIVSSDFVPRWADRLNELSSGRSGRLLDIRSPYDSRLKLSGAFSDVAVHRACTTNASYMYLCSLQQLDAERQGEI